MTTKNKILLAFGFAICILVAVYFYEASSYDRSYVIPIFFYLVGAIIIWLNAHKVIIKLLLIILPLLFIIVCVKPVFFAQACPNQIETEYYSNGQKRFERHHRCGVYDGTWEVWNEKGQLRWHENYIMGKKDGECLRYYYSTGFITHKEYYNQDVLDSEISYRDGKKNSTQYYRNYDGNKKETIYIFWNENGKPSGKNVNNSVTENYSDKYISQISTDYDSLGNIW